MKYKTVTIEKTNKMKSYWGQGDLTEAQAHSNPDLISSTALPSSSADPAAPSATKFGPGCP